MQKPSMRYIYLYAASVLLSGVGVLCFFIPADWWGLSIVLLVLGSISFVGTTTYIIIKKIKTAKKRLIFNVCGYIIASCLSVGGIVYAIYAQYYKGHSGFMPGLDALADWLISIFFIVIGVILFIGLTCSNVAYNANEKRMNIQKMSTVSRQ